MLEMMVVKTDGHDQKKQDDHRIEEVCNGDIINQ
jgi:hypothetical protein